MSAARDRLKALYWNSSAVDPVTNPGGMDDDGHVLNFPLALRDVGDVGQEIVDDNDATKVAILADNDATLAGVVADNDATEAAIVILATSALASKDTAVAAKDVAVQKAADASLSSGAAVRAVTANFPERLEATGIFFSEVLVGDPGAIANVPGPKIVFAANYGYVYQAAGGATLAHKGVLTAAQELVFEIAVEIEQTAVGGGETPAARIRLQGLDKDYVSTGAATTGPLVVTPIGVTVITRRFAYVVPTGGTAWPQPGSAVWLRPAVDINRKSDDSAAAAGSTARVRRMSIRDVTAVVAAEVAAAAAAAAAGGVTQSTQAEAEAGVRPDSVMSPLQTAQAIAFQATPVGGMVMAFASPGARFLLADGSSYLKASYPALAAILGDRHAAYTFATPAVSGVETRAIYAEAGLAIIGGVGGRLDTTVDGVAFTNRAGATANFAYATGAVKAAAKYFFYGIGTVPANRSLVSSANGTTGWADVATFGTFVNGNADISCMAYGVLGATPTLVAIGGLLAGSLQTRYSTDQGVTWADGTGAGVSVPADLAAPKVVIANGVVATWSPAGGVEFKRGTSVAALSAVTGPAAAPTSFDVGNNLFVGVISGGVIYTSADCLTWTRREPPIGMTGVQAYLGYFNGGHVFLAVVDGSYRLYGTVDFASWYRMSMPQAVGTYGRKFFPFGNKVLATFPGVANYGLIAVGSWLHNPATEFTTPSVIDLAPTYIKAF